jgi:uncharacterized spore protein YtfJ
MRRTILIVITTALLLASVAAGETNELAAALAQRLSTELHVKTSVGEPIKVGSVTLIPIMMIDVSFGGAGMHAPAPPAPPVAVDGFYMSGEARPLGFVVISKNGTRFISLTKAAPARKP